VIALAADDTFVKPHIEYGSLWPILVIFGAACVGVLIEAFLPRQWRYAAQFGTTLVAMIVALVGVGFVANGLPKLGGGTARGLFGSQGTIALDGPTMFLWGLVLVFGLGGVLLFAERRVESGVSAFAGQAAALPGTESERQAEGLDHTEVYPLLLFALGGMMLFPAAGDLLTMFVALEVLSLPLYLLCGLARRRRLLSQEAAMKYFLLGAFSSGFFLYGVALIYGYAGSMDFGAINEAVANNAGNQTLLVIGMGMLTVGLLFKVGAAPFQAWVPDVYQGAPTAVTAFMAAATKAAAFGAILRLFYVAFGQARWTWQPMMWVIAILTMIVGTVLALVQTDMKRMLAYSSVAHTGFLLTGVVGLQGSDEIHPGQITSLQAVMFYLVTYGLTTLGAFAVVGLVRDSAG
jgi:NADH-quinone oxidoreductase subunit N